MTETKTREPLVFSPLEDESATETLPEPIPLTPEQMRAQAEADERDRQRQLEWALVVQALTDNSLAVVRAMRRFRNEAEQEQVERVLRFAASLNDAIDAKVLIAVGAGDLPAALILISPRWQNVHSNPHTRTSVKILASFRQMRKRSCAGGNLT